MAYTASAQLQISLTATQLFDTTSLPAGASGGTAVTHPGFNLDTGLRNSSSSVPVTDIVAIKKTMSGGAGTVDLTSLTGTLGESVSLSGKKVQAVIFKNPAANADAITITDGASNGHELMGDGWKIILSPGQQFGWDGAEASQDVDGTHKTWDLSGTGAQYLQILIVAG